jgi:large subunit ribosomal protein L6e
MAKLGKKQIRTSARNPELIPGVRRYGRAIASQKGAKYKHAKLGAKGKQTPGKAKAAISTAEPRFYSADDVKIPLRSHKSNKPTKLRASIQPGTVVIILAGRFRGKRVIVLKQLQPSGLLLVTGPFKINGVPLRRVNQAYVIATSTKVDVSKVDVSAVSDAFFTKVKVAKSAKKDGEEFFANKEKKSEVSAARKEAQKKVDAVLKPIINATPNLHHYLNAKFTLTAGQFPHQLKF